MEIKPPKKFLILSIRWNRVKFRGLGLFEILRLIMNFKNLKIFSSHSNSFIGIIETKDSSLLKLSKSF